MHAELLFKSFPNQKMLHVVRNPIDVAYAWFNKNYGKKETYKEPRIRILTYEYKNHLIPYYAKGWEDEYLELDETDRVVQLLHSVHLKHEKAYNNISNKNQKIFS